jgi:tight adherence protein B
MQAGVLFLVFVAVMMLVLGVYTFINRESLATEEATREHLRALRTGATEQISIIREERRSAVPLVDSLLREQPLAARMEAELQRAGLRWTVGEFVLGSLVTAAFTLFILQFLNLFVAALGMMFGLFVLYFYVRRARKKREAKMEMQLPDAVDMIVNAMKAGFSLQAAMQFVGQEMAAPLGTEFFRLSEEQRLGVDTRAALLDLEARVGSLDAKMFVTSLLIQRETGGNLSEVLTGLANLIRERVALRERIATLTAEPRATAIILSLLPVVLFFLLFAMNRKFMMPLLTTTTGWWVLGYSAVSAALGYIVLSRMADVEV